MIRRPAAILAILAALLAACTASSPVALDSPRKPKASAGPAATGSAAAASPPSSAPGTAAPSTAASPPASPAPSAAPSGAPSVVPSGPASTPPTASSAPGLHTIAAYAREVSLAVGREALAADDPVAPKGLFGLSGVAVAPDGSVVICTDNGRVLRANPTAGTVVHVAGTDQNPTPEPGFEGENRDGPAREAILYRPNAVVVDADGAIYVATDDQVRRIKDGVVETIAGTRAMGQVVFEGPGAEVHLETVGALALDGAGGLFVGEVGTIRRIDLTAPGFPVTLVAGLTVPGGGPTTGPAAATKFSFVDGLAPDGKGGLYVTDTSLPAIRRIDLKAPDRAVAVVAGGVAGGADGVGTAAQLDAVVAMAVLSDGTLLFVDRGNFKERQPRIRQMDASGHVTPFLGGQDWKGPRVGVGDTVALYSPKALARAADGTLYLGSSDSELYAIR